MDNFYNLEELNNFYRKRAEIAVQSVKLAMEAPLQFVYGYGNENAQAVLIGEAPGKDEVKNGRPFVGKAGAILDGILNSTGIKREQLYITNVVKYRLMKQGSREGSYKNRPATKQEIELSLPWLKNELEMIRPKLILTLGNVPLKSLCLIKNCAILEIGGCHGECMDISINGHKTSFIPLYHPASQIYNRSLKEVFDEDFGIVKDTFMKLSGE